MKRMTIITIALIASAILFPTGASAQHDENGNLGEKEFVTKAGRIDRSKMNIGVYHLRPYARTEAHIKDLADCGIDFVICMNNDRPALDLFQKYGVGAILSGIVPGWWGGFGDNAGTLRNVNPPSVYEERAAKFEDHPAVWGIDIGDEPSCWDFPYYGEVLAQVEKLFPNQFAFINLHPYYAPGPREGEYPVKGALGTASYQDYIDRYCRYIPADYISYDFYYLQEAAGPQKAYANLRIIADACLRTNRDMWITVQVNSLDPKAWVTENQLRWQAFSAMAYGARSITWACYTAGWWDNQVVDKDGNKTQQYDKLKKVNAEIHRISRRYMKYRRVETTFAGFNDAMLEGSLEKSVMVYGDDVFSDLSAGCPIVVGRMEPCTDKSGKTAKGVGKGDRALFVCLADDPHDKAPKTRTLRFKAPGREVSVLGGDGYLPLERDGEGWYKCTVSSCQGVLIEASE